MEYLARYFADGHGKRKWGVVLRWSNGKERRIGNTFPTRAQAAAVAADWNRRVTTKQEREEKHE